MALQRFHQQDEFLGKHGRGLVGEFWRRAITAPGGAIPGGRYACLPQMGGFGRQVITTWSIQSGSCYSAPMICDLVPIASVLCEQPVESTVDLGLVGSGGVATHIR